MIVADTNIIAHLTIRGEFSPLAEAVYAADASWAAPLLWRSEYRNTLMKYVQHRGMTIGSALLSLRSALGPPSITVMFNFLITSVSSRIFPAPPPFSEMRV